MLTNSSYRRRVRVCAVVLGGMLVCACGCSPGIYWRGASYQAVHTDSVRDHKLTVVYFRNWATVECTEFEEGVLKNPDVREALRPEGSFYSVPLEFYWDRSLAEQFGVEAPPGVVIVGDDGRVLSRLTGRISVDQLLEALRQAERRNESVLRRVNSP